MSKKVLRSIALITMIVLAFSVSAAAIGFKPSVSAASASQSASTATDKAALEKAAGTKAENLKVSDLFDLWTNSPEEIALTFKNALADGEKFAALYRDYNGNWKILNATVDGINVDIDGLTSGTVVFLTAEKGSSTPDTGDYTNSWMWIAVAGVAVVGIAVLAVCLVRSKKQENN